MLKKLSCAALGCGASVVILFVCLIASLAIAPLFYAGGWEDDPQNYQRAYQQSVKPDDLEIVHSRYMRTPHFTYEYEYYFEVRPNKKLLDAWVTSGQLKRYESESEMRLDDHFEDKPVWFTPKSIDNYDVYIFKDEPRQNFRLFIDKQTGELFYTDFST